MARLIRNLPENFMYGSAGQGQNELEWQGVNKLIRNTLNGSQTQ